jgi:hypothetical protein
VAVTKLAVLVVAVAATLASGAQAAGFDPVLKPTSAGMAAAHHALVTGGDLGTRWTNGGAFTPTPSAIPCASLEPNESSLVETGVGGTSFDHGPWLNVTAAARVFATPAEAEASWRHTDVRSLAQCYERALEGDGQKLVAERPLAVASPARHSAGFRLVTTVSRAPTVGNGPKLVLHLYTDLFALSSGTTQELVAFSAFTSPLSRTFEDRIVRQVGERLAARRAAS